MKKTLYLIPIPLHEDGIYSLPQHTIDTIHRLDAFIVEKAKTCRRFVAKTRPPRPIHDMLFMEMDKHDPVNNLPIIKDIFADHDEVGLMSEAGCPGVADPGSMFVRQAHHQGIKVVPLTGPSSILLALMASGMNGQNFQFQGYLSPKKDQLRKDILALEKIAKQKQSTQIFIETPYRNKAMIELLFSTLHPDTLVCIAANITAPTEFIQTHTIKQWKSTQLPDLHKIPCIFLMGIR